MDQITKSIVVAKLSEPMELVGSFLQFTLVRNSGGLFGIGPGASFAFFTITAVILIVVVVWAWNSSEHALAAGIVVGGGMGNLIDRVFRSPAPFRGEVVDFIDLSIWPTFNVADSAITIGVVLILLGTLGRSATE